MAIVTVNPSGRMFRCEGKQTILEAALAASVALAYGCSMGTCGRCQTRLLQGEIERVKHHDFSIKEADRLHGDFLSCAYTASSDIVIEALEATTSADIPIQHINAKIKGMAQVSRDIGILSVQTPRSTRLRFLPGQNVRLTLDNGMRADFPIASCPCDDRNLEFHVRRLTNDLFSCFLFEHTAFPLPVRIDGPWGFVEKSNSDGPVICLAFDTHIAAIKSWIEQQLADEAEHRIDLLWFAAERDFYLSKLLSAWCDAFDTFTYKLISVRGSDAMANIVNPNLLRNSVHLSDANMIFVAGPNDFLEAIRYCLYELGLTEYALWAHSLDKPGRVEV